MTSTITLLRYLLILIPAVCSMYLETYPSNGEFVFFTLLLLALAVLRNSKAGSPLSVLLLLLEITYGAWLAFAFEGIMFVVMYAALLTCLQPFSGRLLYPALLFQALMLNAAMQGRPAELWAAADLMFAALTALLLYIRTASEDKKQVELLYDELRKKHYELDEARERLMDYAIQVETIAQAEERNRIARDLHDELGHKLIRLKMMMEAAVHILPGQPDQGLDIAVAVRDQLGESMELLRSTVRKWKPDEAAVQSYSLTRLIAGLGQENGIQVRHEIQGMPYSLYPSLEFILYRNAQEAITNAVRHGGATEVIISLNYESKLVRMQVSNNGVLPAALSRRGMGLSGMEERTQLVGGKLAIASDSGLFTVTTTLPTYRGMAAP